MTENRREYAPRPSGHRVIEPEQETKVEPTKTTRRTAKAEADTEEE